jgi:hypothetical protein
MIITDREARIFERQAEMKRRAPEDWRRTWDRFDSARDASKPTPEPAEPSRATI